MSIKFNLLQSRRSTVSGLLLGVWFALTLLIPGMAHSAPVAAETARRVAEGQLRQHLALYGHWNHRTNPRLGEAQQVRFDDHTVAFHFDVLPSGHILVAVDDLLSPVLLYSERSSFDPDRAGFSGSVESWIIPELSHRLKVRQLRNADARARAAVLTASPRIQKAWQHYTPQDGDAAGAEDHIEPITGLTTPDRAATAVVGPLLTSSWGQDSPYNAMVPNAGCVGESELALVGCVGTAWAQLMRYWRWPYRGSGVHEYDWEGQTLSLDYDSAAPYDWENMPGMLTAGSPQTQIDAVAQLLYHAAISAETDFGCNTSVSIRFADEVLDTYFNYQSDMQVYDRAAAILSDDQWFAYFKNELDADPPRPVVLSIWGTSGGHEVIADGYQSGATDLVHINFGWEGNIDFFYNVTDDFPAGGIVWDADTQIIVTGIEPDNQPPVITMGDDQQVGEGVSVQLSSAASDPEMTGDITYQWTQTSGTSVALADADTPTPTFTAPQVHAETPLVFQLRVTDYNRAFSMDTVEVTVENSDGSIPRAVSSSGAGSGCFIGGLWPVGFETASNQRRAAGF